MGPSYRRKCNSIFLGDRIYGCVSYSDGSRIGPIYYPLLFLSDSHCHHHDDPDHSRIIRYYRTLHQFSVCIEYSGRNDGSRVSIQYLSGETRSTQCSQEHAISGIQPVSSFIIHVVPPIGEQGTPRTMTQPTAEEFKAPATTPSTPAPTRAPTGVLLAAGAFAIIALGLRRQGI